MLEEIRSSINSTNGAPFRMINLKKTFYGYKSCFRHDPSKDFHAVRGLYLTIEPKTLFCLLGHNGVRRSCLSRSPLLTISSLCRRERFAMKFGRRQLLPHRFVRQTTSINVLTGQMNPTEGDAIILGHSIRTQMKQIQKRMGFCPQVWIPFTLCRHCCR